MTKIPYCDETWNVTAGCTKCSPGCLNCWAEKWAHRLGCMGQPFYDMVQDEGRWNGIIELNKFILDQPLHWRKPRRIFICSMSDLFHPEVPFEFIDKVFIQLYRLRRHTFLILTKRPDRMLDYLDDDKWCLRILKSFKNWTPELRLTGRIPMPNVQLGVSISNQVEADEKIPTLLQIPAAVRWLSIEPMLEDIDLTGFKPWYGTFKENQQDKGLQWVVVGCESLGRKAGRFQDGFIEAARSLVGQCQVANVPVYVKQIPINGKVSRNPKEWPKDLRIQQLAKKR